MFEKLRSKNSVTDHSLLQSLSGKVEEMIKATTTSQDLGEIQQGVTTLVAFAALFVVQRHLTPGM